VRSTLKGAARVNNSLERYILSLEKISSPEEKFADLFFMDFLIKKI